MKPLNICPVKVGDYVRYGSGGDWERVFRVKRCKRYDRWLVYADGKDDDPEIPWEIISESNMCGMEVKRDTNQ
jgi:hypothetical protein